MNESFFEKGRANQIMLLIIAPICQVFTMCQELYFMYITSLNPHYK